MYGAHLAEVLGGDERARWLLACTAKIDLQWLLSAVPSLAHTRVVLALHGTCPQERWERFAGACILHTTSHCARFPMQPVLCCHAPGSSSAVRRLESGCLCSGEGTPPRAVGAWPETWTVHQPPLLKGETHGMHHTKCFLAVFERGVRLVVHTANLTYPVWCLYKRLVEQPGCVAGLISACVPARGAAAACARAETQAALCCSSAT